MYDELQSDYTYKYDLLRTLLMEVMHGAQKMQPAHGSRL
jgi:AraC family transcriptional activator of pobA